MKSNDVRMQIDRKLHSRFKRVNGNTNDERMKKLLADSKDKYELACLAGYHKEKVKGLRAICKHRNATIKTLASALAVSIAVSVCSVAYVCAVNGWLS
ncbi:TMhelix containing protein [Vibrio phage 1.039.O._10N.286.55.A2]|nr:TMhelix containing protein [Vibrio phage 1.039.O._10N.286.55.A2]